MSAKAQATIWEALNSGKASDPCVRPSFWQAASLEERYHINHSMLKLEFLSRLDRLATFRSRRKSLGGWRMTTRTAPCAFSH